MKRDVIGLDGKSEKKADLPEVFESPMRSDLVKRAFWLSKSHSFQPKGRDPLAGERTTAETHSPPTGTGQSRIPRVKGDRYPKSGMAAGVASVVKGRLPHPPRSEKVIHLKINKKERRLATRSAIAFTSDADSVRKRGHKLTKVDVPLVVSDDLESLAKTSELVEFLEKAGLGEELKRLYGGIRRNSGKGRLRGRVYSERVGPLIVVTNDRGVGAAAASVPGVDVARVEDLSVLHLAPGGVPGRLTLWTESSLEAVSAAKEETKVAS